MPPAATTPTASTPAGLTVEHLTVAFPDAVHPAVDDVTVEVAPGEVVAQLGPSGGGKTSVLRCVAGLQAPTAGRILLDAVDVTDRPAHRRGVGLMFQDYALFPHRDVGANVAFGLRMLGRSKHEQRRRVAEVLDLVGLAGWESRAVAPLSGGEQQRVALARALAPAPGVLLLDEPLGALDRSLRDRLLPEMAELFRALGTTVVHVTHDQGEALGMADRVVVMDQGRIAQVGAPAEVWSRPATAAVARFLGFANVDDDHLVRPDAVHLTAPLDRGTGSALPDGPAQGADREAGDRGVGVVESVVFTGERADVRVRLADGSALEASVATGVALAPGGPGLPRIGDRVGVTVDPSGVVRFG